MQTTLLFTLSLLTLSLLTACGGASSSSNSDSFEGNWSRCYAGTELQNFAKKTLKTTLSTKVKSLKINSNIDSTTTKLIVSAYFANTQCSGKPDTSQKTESCSYTKAGTKTASSGVTLNKIDLTCKGVTTKGVYLIKDGKLYIGNSKEKDAQGYPNDVLYDFYLTK